MYLSFITYFFSLNPPLLSINVILTYHSFFFRSPSFRLILEFSLANFDVVFSKLFYFWQWNEDSVNSNSQRASLFCSWRNHQDNTSAEVLISNKTKGYQSDPKLVNLFTFWIVLLWIGFSIYRQNFLKIESKLLSINITFLKNSFELIIYLETK